MIEQLLYLLTLAPDATAYFLLCPVVAFFAALALTGKAPFAWDTDNLRPMATLMFLFTGAAMCFLYLSFSDPSPLYKVVS